ncbi:hypothetical protein LAZ67_16000383 [Cordylochernes scorpioides]|uniref:Lon proteolytic domain-containing protein n=1 Tax=Cordylochernes scorpioides TaxID=51811 RepID=A0ABY6LFD8_9ARAC|nr:hypothetical protein LAZ67_16000383 [Cordylochernes scorpioides]
MEVGSIKEKIMAAHRFGLKQIILPERNKKNLVDLPESVRKKYNRNQPRVFISTEAASLTSPMEGVTKSPETSREADLATVSKEDPTCPHCQDEDQTVDHLLFTFLPNLPIPKIPDSHSPRYHQHMSSIPRKSPKKEICLATPH